MESAHVSQVAQLEKLCFSAPWSENSISSELTNPLSCWLVALDESDMMNIAVDPQYRRQGIAQALVEELVKCLARKGSRCLTLEVRASNAGAIALYGKLGFVQVGLRKNYYRNPREDAMILRKEWTV